jgi:hypothetical protein
MVECSSVLEECSTSVFRVTDGFRWMLKWLERKGCVSCVTVGVDFGQSELWKGEERVGLALHLLEFGRYKDWLCKGNSGRCANGQA